MTLTTPRFEQLVTKYGLKINHAQFKCVVDLFNQNTAAINACSVDAVKLDNDSFVVDTDKFCEPDGMITGKTLCYNTWSVLDAGGHSIGVRQYVYDKVLGEHFVIVVVIPDPEKTSGVAAYEIPLLREDGKYVGAK